MAAEIHEIDGAIVVLDSDLSESNMDGGEDGAAKTGGACIGSSDSSFACKKLPSFLQKLYDMLSNNEINSLESWNCTADLFAVNVLPMYFKHTKFQSFFTRLNLYVSMNISNMIPYVNVLTFSLRK